MRKIVTLFAFLLSCFIMMANAQPPSTATIESWYMSYTMSSSFDTESDSDPINVAIDGNDVYFQLPTPFGFKAWVVGTISGTTATFAKGQLMGKYGDSNVYLAGSAGKDVTDVTFYYDSQSKAFSANCYVLYNTSATEFAPLCSFYPLVIEKEKSTPTPEPETMPAPVTPPATLTTSEYQFSAINLMPSEEGWVQEKVCYNVRLGFDGINVYIQGLCRLLPEAWIKGVRDVTDGDLTFTSGQYYGNYNGYNFCFAGANFPTTNPTWKDNVDFIYYKTTGEYSFTGGMITLNSSAKTLAPYEYYASCKLTPVKDVAATPAAPSVIDYQPYIQNPSDPNDGYGFFRLDIPVTSTNGEPLMTDKLGYKIYYEISGQSSVYTFTPALYKRLESDLIVVPYNFNDGHDFYIAGSAVYYYDDVKDADKVGVQSVYTGGNETHESEIAWFDIRASLTGVNAAEAVESKVVSESYTDLQGRKVSPSTKGVLLKTTRMSDGTVKTVKVIRK